MKFTTIELFAGAGGLALGLERAGFEPLALVEIDRDAAMTLRSNRPCWNVIHIDIAEISCGDLPGYFGIESGKLDLLSGGAPCQAFSYAGKKLGFDDARGTLFYHYALFLKKLQPKIFLFENVRGLLSHDKGRTYKTMLKVFSECGYTVQKKILNAWDYGNAQKRERLITIGIRGDIHIAVDFPEPRNYKPVLRDILHDVPESPCTRYSERKKELFRLIPPGGNWRNLPEKVAREYMKGCWNLGGGRAGILRRMSMDEPSLSVLTSPTQKQTERCHPEEIRLFSVRENARIQSFPDDWKFCGSIASQYRQIGNAVPVNLAFDIGLEIRKGLDIGLSATRFSGKGINPTTI